MSLSRLFNYVSRKLLYIWVRTEVIPADPAQLGLDPDIPVIYVLDVRAWSNLLVLEQEAGRMGLVSPLLRLPVAVEQVLQIPEGLYHSATEMLCDATSSLYLGRGILFMVATTMVFAVQDAFSRHLAESYSVFMIVMIRYWFFAAFVIALASRSRGGIARAARTEQPWLQAGAGVQRCLEAIRPAVKRRLHMGR